MKAVLRLAERLAAVSRNLVRQGLGSLTLNTKMGLRKTWNSIVDTRELHLFCSYTLTISYVFFISYLLYIMSALHFVCLYDWKTWTSDSQF